VQEEKVDYKNIYYPPGGILLWIVIFLELITFGMALVGFAYYGKTNPEIYSESAPLLNKTFGAINTVLLLISGFFMATAVHQFKTGNQKKYSLFLLLTMLGGILFLGFKSFEYFHKIESGLTLGYNTFFTFYWLLTLFHVIHVLVGMVILISLYRGSKKEKLLTKLEDLEAGAAFWHMCDLIWLILFPILYLIF